MDWSSLWKRWKRKVQHPPNSLALFQVFDQTPPPPEGYAGPLWRYQVEESVKLECHLLPVADEPSFLKTRQGPDLQVFPPILKLTGEIQAEQPERLPLTDWIEKGTHWWLRRLSAGQITGLMAYLLLAGHARLDRQQFPEMDRTLTSLLAHCQPAPSPPPQPPPPKSTPVLSLGAEEPLPPRPRPWARAPVEVKAGPATVHFLERQDGDCFWAVAGREYWMPLWKDSRLSLLIEVAAWEGTREELATVVRTSMVSQKKAIIRKFDRLQAARKRLVPWLEGMA